MGSMTNSIIGTSTQGGTITTHEFNNPNDYYQVVLLIIIASILFLDLVRRLFARK